jgi:hypothetical protein
MCCSSGFIYIFALQFQHERAAGGRPPCLPGRERLVKPFRFPASPYEYKVVPLRECPTPESLQLCDTPDKAAEYRRLHLPKNPFFNPDCEWGRIAKVSIDYLGRPAKLPSSPEVMLEPSFGLLWDVPEIATRIKLQTKLNEKAITQTCQ